MVAPVDVDVVVDVVVGGGSSSSPGGSSGVVFSSGSVDVSAGVVSAGVSDDDDSDEGVSAHANPGEPVTTAAPTPRATAKPPTRPT